MGGEQHRLLSLRGEHSECCPRCPVTMDDWDEAFHAFQVKLITVQRELLNIRRTHEHEVLGMEAEMETTDAELDEAERTLKAMTEKTMEKADKLKSLNSELSEVQGVLLQTQKQHNSKVKQLNKLRKICEEQSQSSSEKRLDNEAKRNELKTHNRHLATKQTELIGYRHEIYVLKQHIGHMQGEELEDLDLEELEELLAKVEHADAAVDTQEADWVTKQLEYFESEIQFALADEDFEKANDMKKQRDALREAEGIAASPTKGEALEDDDDL